MPRKKKEPETINISKDTINEFVRLQKQVEDAEKELSSLELANPGICHAYFASQTKELFEQNPRLYSFGWHQYTPGWNDGDACYFSAHTDCPYINGVNYDELIYEDEHEEEEIEVEGSAEKPLPLTKEEAGDLSKKVVDFLSRFKDHQLEHWFGDGIKITCTRKGITTDSYDCGY
jgi:hypothetical protein